MVMRCRSPADKPAFGKIAQIPLAETAASESEFTILGDWRSQVWRSGKAAEQEVVARRRRRHERHDYRRDESLMERQSCLTLATYKLDAARKCRALVAVAVRATIHAHFSAWVPDLRGKSSARAAGQGRNESEHRD